MKRLNRALVCLLIVFVHFAPSLKAEEVKKAIKLLTIGNSFAGNSTEYLPAYAKAAGKDLIIFRANPGGCSLERHAKAMQAFELNPADPAGQLYKSAFFPVREGAKKTYALQEVLAAEKWDYVTIQQVSTASFKYETFEPFATDIINCIRKLAPTAEILIHQTWAYREDYPGFADGTFNQQMMFDGLVSAYAKLGEAHQLRIIPVGTAIQEARKLPRWTFKFPDPNFNYVDPVPGTRPNQAGSMSVGWTIAKVKAKPVTPAPDAEEEEQTVTTTSEAGTTVVKENPVTKTERLVASLDFKHANADAKYLGAAVFYGFLFNEKAVDVTYAPATVKPEDAVVLRGIADMVLAKTKDAKRVPVAH